MEKIIKILLGLIIVGVISSTLVLILGVGLGIPFFVSYASELSGVSIAFLFAGAMGIIIRFLSRR